MAQPLPPLQPGQPDLADTAYFDFPLELTDDRRAQILTRLTTTQAGLEALQSQLLNPPFPDKPGSAQRPPLTRAKGMFPFLLIRSWATPGQPYDYGARPFEGNFLASPDILITDANEDSTHGGAVEFQLGVHRPIADDHNLAVGRTYNVWVHPWNLGQFAAYGIRVRVWAWMDINRSPGLVDPQQDARRPDFDPASRPRYLGGTWLDLGDRTSGQAHRIVHVTEWTPAFAGLPDQSGQQKQALIAVADCSADGVQLDAPFLPTLDRHVGMRGCVVELQSPQVPPPR